MATDLIVGADGRARFGAASWRCALGRSGVGRDKREGDGATPAGAWPPRRVLYRADRIQAPRCAFDVAALSPQSGWCDDPADPRYNQFVTLPYPARTEALWRADHLYDLIVPLGYNDAPVVPGKGSAIFLHVAQPDYAPTEGCVALALADLLDFLAGADAATRVVVAP